MTKHKKKREKNPNEKPISLHPLEFEEAVKAIMQVKPEKKKVKKRRKKDE